MRHSIRCRLVGPVLALVVLGAGVATPALDAQTPWAPPPPTAPSPGTGGLAAPAPGQPPGTALEPGLPTKRPAGAVLQRQGDLLRFSRNVPGDAKPILIDADEVTTWKEDGRLVLLLRGQVLVQQNVAQVRFQQGVVWVDMRRFQTTGIWHVDLYADGQVRLDTTLESQEAVHAALDLNTRGEFRLRAHGGKVNQNQDRSSDPLVKRARDLGIGPRQPASPSVTPAPALVPASNSTPAPAPASGGGLKQTSFQSQAPGSKGPAPAEFVLAQATVPAPTVPGPSPSPAQIEPPIPSPPPPDPQRQAPLPDPQNQPPIGPPPIGPTPRDGETAPPPELPPPSTPAGPPRPAPARGPAPPRQYRILPRSGDNFDLEIKTEPDGRKVIMVTRGVILNVRNVPKIGSLDVEADRAVVWTKGGDPEKTAANLRSEQGESASELEFYMAGHVILRVQDPKGQDKSVLESDEMYFDTNRNVAVALNAHLELMTNRFNPRSAVLTKPIVLNTPELIQTSERTFELARSEISASELQSDPGLKIIMSRATVVDQTRPQTNLFGTPVVDPKTGKPLEIEETIIRARNVFTTIEDIPVFYTPYLVTDARDPMGPLRTITLGGNRIFGFQSGVGLDGYKLLGLKPPDGTRWRIYLDYMSRRGPAMGTNFNYLGKLFKTEPLDLDAKPGLYFGEVRLYGIYDKGNDILAAQPPQYFTFQPPGWRGRALWHQNVTDLPYGFNVYSQVSFVSDRNFIQEYFKREWDTETTQSHYVYVKQQQDNWAWSALGQAQSTPSLTTTEWLPRGDGYLIGQSFFGLFTSDTHVSAGYAQLRPVTDPPEANIPIGNIPATIPSSVLFPTDQRVNTGRFFIQEELALPLNLGPFKVVPYAKGVLADYTHDLAGNETGRVWGGGGVRGSMPLSRIYPDVCSELFNVNGFNHKMVFSSNYFYARTNQPYTRFPELDRLNDFAVQQSQEEMKPQMPTYFPVAGVDLATSRLYDPQFFAIRKLIDNRIDTLDNIDVLQFDLRQRLQTKRGAPGFEHIVDWMTLDTSFSYYPESSRDNLGKPFSFVQYSYVWNIGDRTSFESTGWYDPHIHGPRVFTVGVYVSRPDRAGFYIGYRQIDPLDSRMITGSFNYAFSPKYSMTLISSYDLGVSQALNESLLFTRRGKDLQISVGFTYNSLQNNIGAIVEIVPNLIPMNPAAGMGALSTGQGGVLSR